MGEAKHKNVFIVMSKGKCPYYRKAGFEMQECVFAFTYGSSLICLHTLS